MVEHLLSWPSARAPRLTGLTPDDLRDVGAQVVLGNTYHLMLRQGPTCFGACGIHRLHEVVGSGADRLRAATRSSRSRRTRTHQREGGALQELSVDQRMYLLSPERSSRCRRRSAPTSLMVLDECVDSNSDEQRTRGHGAHAPLGPAQPRCAQQPGAGPVRHRARRRGWPSLRKESAEFLTQHPFDGFAISRLAWVIRAANAEENDALLGRAVAREIGLVIDGRRHAA